MFDALVIKPEFDSAHVLDFGPARNEHRTKGCGLTQLGTYFMTFDTDELTDPWTVQYEETLFVIEGRLTLVLDGSDADQEFVGEPGELLVLPIGTTVRYGGTPGTRLLLSIAPVHWRT